jgi:hypothetical protein
MSHAQAEAWVETRRSDSSSTDELLVRTFLFYSGFKLSIHIFTTGSARTATEAWAKYQRRVSLTQTLPKFSANTETLYCSFTPDDISPASAAPDQLPFGIRIRACRL